MPDNTVSEVVGRLRSTAPLPVCPFDRRSPDYWTAGENNAPCTVCGGTEEVDKCRRADTRIMEQAADLIERLASQVEGLEKERDELTDRLCVRKAAGWELQGSLYEGFSTELWANDREPGKRTVAIVRDFGDAQLILAILARAETLSADLAEAVEALGEIADGMPGVRGTHRAGEMRRRASQVHAKHKKDGKPQGDRTGQ